MCHRAWEQGDFGVVIGIINGDTGSLAFVHRDCLMVEVLGDNMTHVIAREKVIHDER